MKTIKIVAITVALSSTAMAGPVAYATCQAACAASLAAGPAAVAIYAACQAACAALLAMPGP